MATARSTSTLAGAVAALALLLPAHAVAQDGGYGWPVKPFHAEHPVRGYFGDPRIGMTPDGMRSSFHFGIDISVPDGTPVYARLTGTVRLWSHRPETVGVVGADTRLMFSYWHIRRSVSAGHPSPTTGNTTGSTPSGRGRTRRGATGATGSTSPMTGTRGRCATVAATSTSRRRTPVRTGLSVASRSGSETGSPDRERAVRSP